MNKQVKAFLSKVCCGRMVKKSLSNGPAMMTLYDFDYYEPVTPDPAFGFVVGSNNAYPWFWSVRNQTENIISTVGNTTLKTKYNYRESGIIRFEIKRGIKYLIESIRCNQCL